MAEREWERRLAAPALDEALVRALVAAHCEAPLDRVERMHGGKVNAHVRAHLTDGSSVVLRVYLRDPAAADKEAALFALFAGQLPVPHARGRGTCAVEGRTLPYTLLDWIPGDTLDQRFGALDTAALTRAGRETGSALARVHAHSRRHVGFLDAALAVPEPMGPLAEVWAGYIGELLRKPVVAERLGAARRAALEAVIRSESMLIAACGGDIGLLHGDCKPTNLRLTDDGAITGLLDWEFAWSGSRLSDFGQMLRWPLPAAFEEALLAGYEAAGGGRPLDGDGRRAAALLDLLNLVSFLDTETIDERARTAADAIALLDETLAQG